MAETARILFPEAVRDVLGCKVANWGIILAVAAAVIIWVIIEKTTLGYKLKAVGFNRNGALYGGINSDASVLTALSISGALAGLGGAVQILGMAGRLSQFAGQEGYGFQGITVALIGSSNPIGCIFAGLFYEVRRLQAEHCKSAFRGGRHYHGLCDPLYCHCPDLPYPV